ncbi:MAG: Gfo/Idh/MocA family oxidoreductase [Chitinophagaceae bacterium]|nr:Gfo/Idh/MocA family oxidoreductase [Chitinophagaceae bacterium]
MENKPLHQSRRKFVRQGLQAAIAFTIVPRFVLGRGYIAPSDRLNLGFIGTGKQGKILLGYFYKNTQCQAIAGSDVDSRKLAAFQAAAQKAAGESAGKDSYKGFTGYPDFRELLQRKDIDAVVIATPDHWHAVMAVMAANAGKHVYCEKPMAHSVGEGRAMVNAMKKNKVIFQTGSMQRSWDKFRTAVDLVRNGYVGQVKEVLVTVGDPAVPFDLPGMPVPANLNWDAWIGPSVVRPYHTELSPPIEQDVYPHWRNYKEYGGGILSDWGAHMFDIAQWGLDMDRSGPVKFEPPAGDAVKGLVMTYENGIVMKHVDFGRKFAVRFTGDKGSLDISRDFLDSNPANIATATLGSNAKRVYNSNNHYQDWIDAIKNNTQPICDVETGHRSSSVCALANIAYWLRRPLEWDPRKEQFRNDAEANALLTAPIRAPWKLV